MKYLFSFLVFCLMKFAAAQSFSTSPYSTTLPNVNSTQQNSLSAQQAGSMVYNTDQNAINYFNGSVWKSLASGQYTNTRFFTLPLHISSNNEFEWVVPANVNKIFVELYSGGGCGSEAGGGCGGNYGVVMIPVNAGQ